MDIVKAIQVHLNNVTNLCYHFHLGNFDGWEHRKENCLPGFTDTSRAISHMASVYGVFNNFGRFSKETEISQTLTDISDYTTWQYHQMLCDIGLEYSDSAMEPCEWIHGMLDLFAKIYKVELPNQ